MECLKPAAIRVARGFGITVGEVHNELVPQLVPRLGPQAVLQVVPNSLYLTGQLYLRPVVPTAVLLLPSARDFQEGLRGTNCTYSTACTSKAAASVARNSGKLYLRRYCYCLLQGTFGQGWGLGVIVFRWGKRQMSDWKTGEYQLHKAYHCSQLQLVCIQSGFGLYHPEV